MKVGIVGMGHVGLVTAACFAHLGHEAVGVDVDAERVEGLRRGSIPFFEPGLEQLVDDGLRSGRLSFETETGAAVAEPEVAFICVGTPSTPTGEADLTQIEGLAYAAASHMTGYRVLAEKSTVPARTGERLVQTLRRLGAHDVDVVSNPEFLREGSAIRGTLDPDRIVIGSGSERATELLLEVYRPITERSGCEVIVTDVVTAELIKHASNSFLATKISFINAVAEICEATGGDVEVVSRGMGIDPRIGKLFLRAGVGYGGSCFPKDVSAFAALASELGIDFGILKAVQEVNARGPERLVGKLRSELWHLRGKTIAVLGLAFKPGTDDMRDAPSLEVIRRLREEGAEVAAYDPIAAANAKEILGDEVRMADSAIEAMNGAHAAVFVTDWDEFRGLTPAAIRDALQFPIVVDGRNLFALDAMNDEGITYLSVGRPPIKP